MGAERIRTDNANYQTIDGELTDEHRIAVEHAQFRAALGVTVRTTTTWPDGRRHVVDRQLPPDVTAGKLLLAGLAPRRWGQGGAGNEPPVRVIVSIESGAVLRTRLAGATSAQGRYPYQGSDVITAQSEAGQPIERHIEGSLEISEPNEIAQK